MQEVMISLQIDVYTEGVEEYKTINREIGYHELRDLILDWVLNVDNGKGPLSGSTDLSAAFYRSLFPEQDWEKWKVWSQEFEVQNAKPSIGIDSDGLSWVSIRIGDQVPHFAFMNEDGKFEFVPFPDSYSYRRNGSIHGDRIIFRPGEYPYPWVVKYPGRYDVVGRLNYLLQVADSNPATILKRSPQPYKGLGSQVVEIWEELLDLALDSADC